MSFSEKHQEHATASSLSRPQAAHDDDATRKSKRPKRIRPSRARGFRVNTGCVTCRKRRVKCDENKPRCKQCDKSNRGCQYVEPRSPQRQPRRKKPPSPSHNTATDDAEPLGRQQTIDTATSAATTAVATTDIKGGEAGLEAEAPTVCCNINPILVAGGFDTFPCLPPDPDLELRPKQHQTQPDLLQDAANGDNMFLMDDTDLGVVPELSLSGSSHQESPVICGTVSDWNFLAAQDSIDNTVGTAFVDSAREFQSGVKPASAEMSESYYSPEAPTTSSTAEAPAPWNSNDRINAIMEEATYIQYYTDVVGPMLDVMDLSRQFSNAVPHLAMYNTGLFKAMIALAARHMTVHGQCPSNGCTSREGDRPPTPTQVASQYYYGTISYVSKTLYHHSYSKSPEIAATAILISAYEMLDENESSGMGNWERHLRGGFWIQRTQDNNAETECPLQRASWCAWVRQDIWAAFREGRRTLTLFHSRKPLEDLNEEQLAARIILIAARCVDFAAESPSACNVDVHAYVRRGEGLLAELQRWHQLLPRSFHPVAAAPMAKHDQTAFPPVWIHPPAHAAAVQMFHFARIIVSLNQPCVGGRNVYIKQQRRLEDSVRIICGIASARQGEELPSACVNSQALFVAGLCVQTTERRDAVLTLLEKSHRVSKMSGNLAGDLRRVWQGDMYCRQE